MDWWQGLLPGIAGGLVGGFFALGGVWLQQSRQDSRDTKARARQKIDERHTRLRSLYAELLETAYGHERIMGELCMPWIAPAVGVDKRPMAAADLDGLLRQTNEAYTSIRVGLAMDADTAPINEVYDQLHVAMFNYINLPDEAGQTLGEARKALLAVKQSVETLEQCVRAQLHPMETG